MPAPGLQDLGAKSDEHPEQQASFPQTQEEIDNDPRVSWSISGNKYILEEENGTEWAYDPKLQRWIPSLDEDDLARQSEAYAVPGVDQQNTADAFDDFEQNVRAEPGDADKKTKTPRPKRKREKEEKRPAQNTAVYATSIPLDATAEEIEEVFGKYGMIAEALEGGKKRIKLYTDDNGNFKGDALIIFYRPESVELAISMLDDSEFRFGTKGPNGNMRVQVADSSYKKQKDEDKKQHFESRTHYDREKFAKKLKRHKERMEKRIGEWSSEEEEERTRWEKNVVLKHMFTLAELEEDKDAFDEIHEDIQEEASKYGEVTKVKICDKELDGVVIVQFNDFDAAERCAAAFNGRSFDGRTVVAYISQQRENFKAKSLEERTGKSEEARIDEFTTKLEKGELAKDIDGGELPPLSDAAAEGEASKETPGAVAP
ncbi:nuclear mRNA splicing factor-associated protein [Phyllosticta citrichinensis]|uniref:Nuclear mRNA splicing factor-associated protein n=1 Tax=Phyllosticta citrichinensis TaxID=1130410 RepID=A0ABR1XUD0_9PEZI